MITERFHWDWKTGRMKDTYSSFQATKDMRLIERQINDACRSYEKQIAKLEDENEQLKQTCQMVEDTYHSLQKKFYNWDIALSKCREENEQLKKSIKRQQSSNDECAKLIKEQQKENEQLKKENAKMKKRLSLLAEFNQKAIL